LTHPTPPELELDNGRYWRIVRFFAAIIAQLAVVDIILGRIPFVGHAIRRTRPRRFRQMARDFRHLAVEMGGVLIKLGQFLSARVDVLPPEITEELQGLQDEVPAISAADLERILRREYGRRLSEQFSDVEFEPLAAASLGQTVRATLTTGQAVVLKVQRPNIASIVHTDLAALRAIAPWVMRYRPIRRRADVPVLLEEFARTLWEELDYEAEVFHAQKFAKMFAHEPRVYIPKVYEELCTPRVVVLENVENPKINEVEKIKAEGIDTHAVAELLIEVYLYQLFKQGFFHADPHPGNIFIRPVGEPLDEEELAEGRVRPFQIIFIDFGMVGRLPDELRANLSQVLIGIVQNDARAVVNAYDKMGFFLPGSDLERIIQAQAVLMERLEGRNLRQLSNPDPAEIAQIGQEFRDILFDFPFQIPQDFIYLGRALGILSGIASALYPEVNPWYQIERYGLEMFNAQRPTFELNKESWLRLADTVRPYLGMPAQLQRVLRAAENGRLRVQASNPIMERRLERIERRLTVLNWLLAGGAAVWAAVWYWRQKEDGGL
jgi:predicted unusual protein kinase regulating ubiquinone biosynthesis (AarF/ABC1/UbiB family)